MALSTSSAAFGSRRPAANRRRADAAPAPLSVLPGGHLPASIRRISVNLCAKDNQRLVPEHAARRSCRSLRTGAESGEREDRQPSPSSFRRSQGSHRPPGDWTQSIAQGLRDLGRSRAVFPDSESGSFCPNPGAGRLRPRFALSQSRGLKPRGIQPDESSEETEAVWEKILWRGRNNSRIQLRTNAKYNTVHATCRGGAVNETSSLT